MEETVAVASPASGMLPDSGVIPQIIEEGHRVCPLCSSEVKLFFINFHEKLLMCENTECEFPFGYEELQFVRVENSEDVSDLISERSRNRQFSPCMSETSSVGWAETDRLNRACQPEHNLNPKILNVPTKKFNKNKKELYSRKKEKQIQQNVEDLKGLSLELSDMTKTTRVTIKNKKWINNLMQLQDLSGVKLVEPQENENLPKKEKPKSEMKIEFEPGSSGCISSIKIEIANQAASQSQVDLDSLRKMDELNIQ